ncbi:MAG: phosphatidate cytidylyltransferase [Victivallaceae bacterium]|nr:phosphatidate cytidylyltransferase [Victivallaceae bacterium]
MDWIVDKITAISNDHKLLMLLAVVLALLLLGTIFGRILAFRARRAQTDSQLAVNFNARVRSWWIMVAVFALAMATGGIGSVVLFSFTSFLALREFIAIIPTKRADHRLIIWCFWIILPLQYLMVILNWYGMFIILIPVYAFMFIPIRSVIAGDCERFLERTAKIQWGLMACVYCISCAPMLLKLPLSFSNNGLVNARLLFFLVTIVEMSDVLQYCWGKSCGRHKILPSVSPNKTIEGFVGGILSVTVLGAILSLFTPFTVWQAVIITLLVALAGFAGDVTMSAIKRDCQVKDYGTVLAGHGGILDRIDSLCFAAPLFFHIVRYYFGA